MKRPDKCLLTQKIDSDMGVAHPFFDGNLDILYITGKGDSMVRYFVYQNGVFENYNNHHRCKTPGKSYSFQMNYTLDVNKCEIAKFLQVTNTNDII